MSGFEAPALSIASKGVFALFRYLAKSSEFHRLCNRLADRFGEQTGFSAASFMDWGEDEAFMAVLSRYLLPPHEFDRDAFVSAITPLVGPLDDRTPAEAFATQVADAIHHEMRMAKTGDELMRFETDRVLEAVGTPVPAVDLSWVPGRALSALQRLVAHDPQGARQLQQSLAGREARAELATLIDVPPGWLRAASGETWRAIGRLAEVFGLWQQARHAWEEVAERPGADRARALIVAAGAATHIGDTKAAGALRDRARQIDPKHPLLLLAEAIEDEDPASRLNKLSAIHEPADEELRSLWQAAQAMTLLDLDREEEARSLAHLARAAAPELLHVREASAAVVLARNRKLRLAGRGTERQALLRTAEDYQYLRDAMRESQRFGESGWMVQRIAETQSLADRPDLARVTLGDVLDEELDAEDVPLALAESAFNAGDPERAEELLAAYEGEDPAAELMRAHAALRDPKRRAEGVAALDRRVATGDYPAAVLRMTASVPSTREVSWSNAAEELVRAREPALASFIKAEWLEACGRNEEARRELGRHANDPRALRELATRFADQNDWSKAAAHARALLAAHPDLEGQVVAGQVLRRAGVLAEAETALRSVLQAPEAHDEERRIAFDELAQLLLDADRHVDLLALVEHERSAGRPEAAWLAAYALAREGKLREARTRIEGLQPRNVRDARLAADLHFAVDPPAEALRTIVALGDTLDPQDEDVEVKATLALLRSGAEDVTPELVSRAGPMSFVDRFPDSRTLWKERLPDTDEGMLARLRDFTEARARATSEAEHHVLELGDWPVGALAGAAGKSLAETWALLPLLPLSYGDEAELSHEIDAAKAAAGGPIILDTAALHTLQLLDTEVIDALLAEYPLSHKAQATLDDLLQATTLELSDNQERVLTLSWDLEAQRPVATEISAHDARAPRRLAEAMLVLARRLQTAAAGKARSGPSGQREPEQASTRLVEVYRQTTDAARQLGSPVYSDDRVFRRALTASGVAAFSTLAALTHLRRSGALTAEVHRHALEGLRQRGVLGLLDDSTEAPSTIRDEVRRLTNDEVDRDEMRAIREQMEELAPQRDE